MQKNKKTMITNKDPSVFHFPDKAVKINNPKKRIIKAPRETDNRIHNQNIESKI